MAFWDATAGSTARRANTALMSVCAHGPLFLRLARSAAVVPKLCLISDELLSSRTLFCDFGELRNLFLGQIGRLVLWIGIGWRRRDLDSCGVKKHSSPASPRPAQ